jgi:16S rRNA (uracil1498-N3)-methyltransferase
VATAGAAAGAGPERAYAPDLPAAGSATLDAQESAHLVRSRRARAGDAVVLFDGRGRTVHGVLSAADPRAAVVEIQGEYPDRAPRRVVSMAVSLPEAGRADRLVAMLAELGVRRFAPLLAARTPSNRAALATRRGDRWRRLAVEAAKVSGSSVLLSIHEALPFEDALAAGAVLLDPDPGAPPLRDVLGDAETPWLLVGPEGGFDDAERARAREAGARRARTVHAALRIETAACAAAAVALA